MRLPLLMRTWVMKARYSTDFCHLGTVHLTRAGMVSLVGLFDQFRAMMASQLQYLHYQIRKCSGLMVR